MSIESTVSSPNDVIHKLRPQAQVIKPIEEGVINSVFLVDDEVFRFPREEGAKPILLYEAEILGRLAGKTTLNTPKLVEVASGGSYMITSLVFGDMLNSQEIMAFSPEQKKALATSITQCLQEINSVLSIHEVTELVNKYIPWQKPEDEFYQSILNSHTHSKYHQLYASCYERYAQRQKAVGKTQEIVVHGDFHYGNMLFNDKRELTGLIDFGDVNIGTFVTEFRQIYRLGKDIVEDMIANLGNDYGRIDLESVKLLAIVHEVWVLMRTEGQEPPKDGRDKLAKKLLTEWLGKNWGER